MIKLPIEEIAEINRRVTLEKTEPARENGKETGEEAIAAGETEEKLPEAAERQGESES